VQLTKNVTFWRSLSGYVRADFLNIFNFHNYDPIAVSYPAATSSDPETALAQSMRAVPQYNRQGPIVGVPFTVKLSAGLRF